MEGVNENVCDIIIVHEARDLAETNIGMRHIQKKCDEQEFRRQ